MAADVCPGTHISVVGSDGPAKQELDPRDSAARRRSCWPIRAASA